MRFLLYLSIYIFRVFGHFSF